MKIQLKDFNQGGIADSKYSGVANSLARMVGFDIHSLPGLMQVNQKMTVISNGTITEFCKCAFEATNGIIYWFSAESGKIWQDKAGVITLVYTTSPGAGSAICVGAREYKGTIYWATQNRLHKIVTTDADGASAWTANASPNFGTFTVGNIDHHPMQDVNQVLYIGDGYLVAQVDAGTFSSNALDISSEYVVTALGKMGTALLVGGSIPNVNLSEVFIWNTYSTSFTSSDTIPERGINCFLEGDNYVFVNAGISGSIYTHNGSQLLFYKRVPGSYTSTKRMIIYPNATAMFKGSIPIFGISNAAGNPGDQGIWSLGKHSNNYHTVFNLEFPISKLDADGYPVVADVEIGAIVVSGVTVYCSWRHAGSTVGVDKLDYSNKIAKPFFETRIISPDRTTLVPYGKFMVHYGELPASTSIVIQTKVDHATDFSDTSEVVDIDRKQVVVDADRQEAKNLEIRVECVSSGNNSPTIEELDIVLS